MTGFACSGFMQWVYSEFDTLFYAGVLFAAYAAYKMALGGKPRADGYKPVKH